MALLALIMIVLGVPTTRVFLRDALQPQTVDGTIEDLQRSKRRSGAGFDVAGQYYVWVNGRKYEVTHDVFLQLRKGGHIRAEAGSGRILSIER